MLEKPSGTASVSCYHATLAVIFGSRTTIPLHGATVILEQVFRLPVHLWNSSGIFSPSLLSGPHWFLTCERVQRLRISMPLSDRFVLPPCSRSTITRAHVTSRPSDRKSWKQYSQNNYSTCLNNILCNESNDRKISSNKNKIQRIFILKQVEE